MCEGAGRRVLDDLSRILAPYSRQRTEMTPHEIAERLGRPRSTVYRLLAQIEEAGFLAVGVGRPVLGRRPGTERSEACARGRGRPTTTFAALPRRATHAKSASWVPES